MVVGAKVVGEEAGVAVLEMMAPFHSTPTRNTPSRSRASAGTPLAHVPRRHTRSASCPTAHSVTLGSRHLKE